MLTETTKLATKLLLTGCAALSLGASGCRSTMPGMNLFGMRSEPSAAVLAGTGPSTTYPAPPSTSATPEAIASIAGGTSIPVSPGEPEAGGTQIAGFESPTTPAFGSNLAASSNPAAGTNMSAAQANGFNTPAQPAGYAFGAKAFTPKPEAAAPPTADVSAYAKSASFTPPPSSYAIPSNAPAPEATSAAPSGFTLPPGVSPALAAASTAPPPTTVDNTTGDFAPPSVPEADFALPADSAPSFSTASTSEEIRAPSTSLSPPLPPSSTSSGYSPGSTAGAVSYPGSGGDSPASSGSFFR
jgi:hypothetical protein